MDGDLQHDALRARAALLRSEVLALAMALTAVTLAARLVLFPLPLDDGAELARRLVRLALLGAADAGFVVLLAAVFWVAAGPCAARRRARRWWRVACYAVFQLSGACAVLSVPAYTASADLVAQSIAVSGGSGATAAAALEHVTPELLAGLAVVAAALCAAAAWAPTCGWLLRGGAAGRRGAAAAVVLVLIYAGGAQAYVARQWSPRRWERRLAQNTQWTLLSACCRACAAGGALDVEPDGSDFEQKPSAPSRTPFDDAPAERPRNVVLIVADFVAAEHLDICGSAYPTTPHLDRLAAERGVVFDEFYVQSPDQPRSLAALLCSVYPRRAAPLVGAAGRAAHDFDVPAVHEVLARRGYRCGAICGTLWDGDDRARFVGRDPAVQLGVQLIDARAQPGPYASFRGVKDAVMLQSAFDWIEQGDDGRPFFLVALTSKFLRGGSGWPRPHAFGAPTARMENYLNAVRELDANIGWFYEQLRATGLDRSTLLVVTADRGLTYGKSKQRHPHAGVFESNVRVPCLLVHPRLAAGPRHVAGPRQQIDLAPTLLHALGQRPPAAWQGRNLWREESGRAYFFKPGDRDVAGLRDGRFKYHLFPATGAELLFDLDADPHEMHDLSSGEVERCRRYRRRIAGLLSHQRGFHDRHRGG